MLELARTGSSYPAQTPATARPGSGPALVLGLARSPAEIEAVQRLRYDVFSEDLGAVFPANARGLDQDRYDRWCEHVIVRESADGRIVGTYRILTPERARLAGGYYTESEFDISALAPLRTGLIEVGRSCVHADFRQGAAIMLLWNGVAEIMRRGGYRYVLGCASVSLRDDGVCAAEVWRQMSPHLDDPSVPRVRPIHRYPVERLAHTLPAKVPPLIKGYLKLGARVCGEPAWDPDFNTADMPVLLDVCKMDARYQRHLKLDYTPCLPVQVGA